MCSILISIVMCFIQMVVCHPYYDPLQAAHSDQTNYRYYGKAPQLLRRIGSLKEEGHPQNLIVGAASEDYAQSVNKPSSAWAGSTGSSSAGYSGGQKSYGKSYGQEKAMPYSFQYDFNDGQGMNQQREETSDDFGNVKGSYGYMDPNGIYRKVEYTSGPEGFKAIVRSNEPGLGSTESPADTVFYVKDPPAGSYGSRKGSSYSGGAPQYKSSSSKSGSSSYRPLDSDYSNIVTLLSPEQSLVRKTTSLYDSPELNHQQSEYKTHYHTPSSARNDETLIATHH